MKKERSHGNNTSMSQEINDFEKTSFENITTVSQEDIWGDTRHKSSLLETIGGPEFKLTSESTLVDVKPAKELNLTEKKLITHYILMKSLTHHGNIFRSILLGSYPNQMASMPS